MAFQTRTASGLRFRSARVRSGNSSSTSAAFERMRRNLLWVVGGKGYAGLISLVYLGLAARGLGLGGFGTFTMILVFGQLVVSLVQLQSWQALIRYGAQHMAEGRGDRLARLLGFGAVVDLGSAIAGGVLTAIGVILAGPMLHWSAPDQHRAILYSAALLLSIGSTPNGILRLHDRFDLVAAAEAMNPSTRLIGSVAAWATGAGLETFLLIWAASAMLQAGCMWALALRTLRRHRREFHLQRRALAAVPCENPGLWRFLWLTNASSSLTLAWQQVGTLAVGAIAGPASAGGFQLAAIIARALAKSIALLNRILYPELARLVASGDASGERHVVRRVSLAAAGVGALLPIVAAFGGHTLLRALGGHGYAFAQPFLLVLSLSTAIDVAAFALEPTLMARGQAGSVVRARMLAVAAYAGAAALLVPSAGAIGVAVASVGASALTATLLLAKIMPLPERRQARGSGAACGNTAAGS